MEQTVSFSDLWTRAGTGIRECDVLPQNFISALSVHTKQHDLRHSLNIANNIQTGTEWETTIKLIKTRKGKY